MGKYMEAWEKAVKDDLVVDLAIQQHGKWQVGDVVIGSLLRIEDREMESGSISHLYVFDTDAGLVSFFLGVRYEEFPWNPGNVYRIEFLGTTDIGGGKKLNNFSVFGVIVAEK